MSVANQALVIFAAEKGFLEDVALNKLAEFEDGLVAFAKQTQADLLEEINKTGDYNKEIEGKLYTLLEEFSALQY